VEESGGNNDPQVVEREISGSRMQFAENYALRSYIGRE
jgi:hypothetical protein